MNLATIIIDMQKFYTQDINHDRLRPIIEAQKNIISYSISKNIPIYNVLMKGDGTTISEIQKVLDGYSNFKSFKKNRMDALNNNFLRKELNKNNINSLYLMGLYSNACVLSTAITASKKFKIYVSDDTMSCEERTLKFYPTVEKRKKSFMSFPEYGGKILGVPENVIYYSNHQDAIYYLENKIKDELSPV